jgi:hypothetical protein
MTPKQKAKNATVTGAADSLSPVTRMEHQYDAKETKSDRRAGMESNVPPPVSCVERADLAEHKRGAEEERNRDHNSRVVR